VTGTSVSVSPVTSALANRIRTRHSRRFQLVILLMAGAGADCAIGLSLRRKYVIVHGDDHGNENDRVIEEMQFNPGKEELEHVEGHWLAH